MKKFTETKTNRGFSKINFLDRDNIDCSIQESSIADEPSIWFGADDIGLKKFIPNKGWEDVQLESELGGMQYIANTRMHLTRKQVKKLIPILQNFVDTSEVKIPKGQK